MIQIQRGNINSPTNDLQMGVQVLVVNCDVAKTENEKNCQNEIRKTFEVIYSMFVKH